MESAKLGSAGMPLNHSAVEGLHNDADLRFEATTAPTATEVARRL